MTTMLDSFVLRIVLDQMEKMIKMKEGLSYWKLNNLFFSLI